MPKQTEDVKRWAKGQFRVLTNLVPGIVWTAHPDGSADFANEQWYELTGCAPDAPLGEAFLQVLHPDDHERVFTSWSEAQRTGSEFRTEMRLRDAHGRYRWFLAQATPFCDDAGLILQWFGLSTEITERKQAEEQLRESEARFRTMADGLPLIIWVHDAEGRQEFVNRTFCEFFGITPEQAAGEGWQMLMHPDDAASYVGEFLSCVRDRRPFHAEVRVRNAAGEWRRIESWGRPRFGASGEFMGLVGASADITERRAAEEALREADHRKNVFLATLAHELRNPLAPIHNAVQILKLQRQPDPTVQAARDMIDRQVQHMVRLVDDLLDVSRITQGRLHLRKERVDLAAVLEQAVEASRPNIERAGHELTVALPPQPVYLDADPVRLAQVFLNLLNNACKYTEKGGRIRLTAEREGKDVVVKVRDTGIGIASEHLPHVFDMFAQVGSALERSQGGLGIGLALARGLVEIHGGGIEVRSEGPGRGTEITVRLPVLTETPAPQPQRPEGLTGRKSAARRILVVDDNQDSAESMADLLRLHGDEVETAYDGLAAVEAAERFRPDVVLLDLGMPKLDGFAVCRRIREQSWGKSMVLIAQTGWGGEEDRRHSEKAGFDAHLVKPVDPAALLGLLSSLQVKA